MEKHKELTGCGGMLVEEVSHDDYQHNTKSIPF